MFVYFSCRGQSLPKIAQSHLGYKLPELGNRRNKKRNSLIAKLEVVVLSSHSCILWTLLQIALVKTVLKNRQL